MKRKTFIVLLPVLLLACNFLFPNQKTPSDSVTVSTALPGESQKPEQIESLTLDRFTIVRLHAGDGDLQSMLADEAHQAASLGLAPVVEFDATWCPPCRAIDKWIKAEDPLMMDAYAGTYIIKLDVDEWEWNDGRVQNFAFDAIPVYFKLDAGGKQTGEVIDGGAWQEDIPRNIAPVMDKFFHGE